MNRRDQIIDKIVTFFSVMLLMAVSAAMGVILALLALTG